MVNKFTQQRPARHGRSISHISVHIHRVLGEAHDSYGSPRADSDVTHRGTAVKGFGLHGALCTLGRQDKANRTDQSSSDTASTQGIRKTEK